MDGSAESPEIAPNTHGTNGLKQRPRLTFRDPPPPIPRPGRRRSPNLKVHILVCPTLRARDPSGALARVIAAGLPDDAGVLTDAANKPRTGSLWV